MMSITALVFTVFFVLAFQQSVSQTLLYCSSITICCWTFIRLIAWGLRRLLRPAHPDWLGWPPTLLSILAGAPLGYTAGTRIADFLLSVHTPGLLEISPRKLVLLWLIATLPGVVVTYFLRSQRQLAEARAQAAEHQLRLLQAQLEPHMLFNTLANLRVLIDMDPPRAQRMLDQLIGFLRASLQASRSGSHALADEFSRLQDYLALMEVRMQERLRPVLLLPDELAALQVPPLLLQPLVENAIKHGLEPALEGGELRVSARREGPMLCLEVLDTGVGLGAPAPGGTQFGLQQVRERLATRYGARAALQLTPHPQGGTLARITLPLT
jgi:LytS/YehU family sensor histidine kinase